MKKFVLTLFIINFSFFSLFAQGLWTKRANLPDSARAIGIGFSIGNYGYVGLGADMRFPVYFKDFWQFNPSNNSWTRKADFPGRARVWPAVFVIGHYAYVVSGGEQNYSKYFVNECWRYDANTNTWTQKANFPGIARIGAVGFSIGKYGYIGTGYDTLSLNYLLRDFWQYDTAIDTWTKKSDFGGTARYCAFGSAINGSGYLCMGIDSAVFTIGANDVWKYDTGNNSWTKKTSNPIDSLGFTSGFAIGSNIYMGAGAQYGYIGLPPFWKYNTITDTWSQVAKYPLSYDSIGLCSGFSIGDTGYLGLGEIARYTCACDSPSNELFRFYPDTLTGIDKVSSLKPDISLYPNPNNGRFTIQIGNSPISSGMGGQIEIYNMFGEKIYFSTNTFHLSPFDIDISPQSPGIYLFRIIGERGNLVSSGKFIVQ